MNSIKMINNNGNIENKDNLSKNLLIIIDLKILQKMNEDFKTDLVTNKKDVLLMVIRLLDFINIEGTLGENIKPQPMNRDEKKILMMRIKRQRKV